MKLVEVPDHHRYATAMDLLGQEDPHAKDIGYQSGHIVISTTQGVVLWGDDGWVLKDEVFASEKVRELMAAW
ncbi:MAG: hypothetical protein HC911_17600 [Chloroflexaceae bacterium]|nr:hypothetical protein [Chloroflexaceae bacterium]